MEEDSFLLVDNPQPIQDHEGRDDQPTPEQEAPAMDEVKSDEVQTELAMWMSERITTLQNENGELKKTAQEIAAKIELHQRVISELCGRFGKMQKAIAQIAEHVQHQNVFNQSVKTSIDELVE